VTCTNCFNIFQLDLFKTYEPKTKMFHCPTCKNVISSYLVESKTVEWFNTMVAFLGVQDLQCVSSKETRTDVLSLFSDIGSEYADKKYPFKSEFEFEILARFRDLSQIAREAGMKNLAWLVDQSLKL
jgi:hypothetical protein